MFILSMVALHRDTIGPIPVPGALLAIGVVAVAFGVYLFSVQAFIIHAYCFWCVLSGLFGISFAALAFLDWRAWRIRQAPVRVSTLQHSESSMPDTQLSK